MEGGTINTQVSGYILWYEKPHWPEVGMSKGLGTELGPQTCCLPT